MSAPAIIDVTRLAGDEPLTFDVTVREGASESRHHVSLSHEDLARLSNGHEAERVIESVFRFLLDREPKESILSRFDVTVIARYFPDFERKLPDYLARG